MDSQVFIEQLSISFNLREPKKRTPTPVYMVCRMDGKQGKIPIGVKVNPEHWSRKLQLAAVNSSKLSKLDIQNNTIANNRIGECLKRFREWKEYIADSPENLIRKRELLKTYITMGEFEQRPIEWFTSWVDNCCLANATTKSTYKREVKLLNDYVKSQNLQLDSFSQLNFSFLKNYEKCLIDNGLQNGSINGKIKVVLHLLREAARLDLVDLGKNGLDDKKWRYLSRVANSSKTVYLTEEEMERIWQLPLKGTREIVRDMFVLQYLLGQRISDIKNIGNARFDMENREIELIQQKTKTKVTLPMLKRVKLILEKYNYQCPPKYTSTHVTRYIKGIAKEAGVTESVQYNEDKAKESTTVTQPKWKLVSSHTARHSLVTNELKKGTSPELIMKITGHSRQEIMDIYNHISSKDSTKHFLNREDLKVEAQDTNSAIAHEQPMNANPVMFLNNESVLDTLFAAKEVTKACDMIDKVGYIDDGKLHSYNDEIASIRNEVKAYLSKDKSELDVAKQYIQNARLLHTYVDLNKDFQALAIGYYPQIGLDKETILSFIERAEYIGVVSEKVSKQLAQMAVEVVTARDVDKEVL